LVKELTMDGRSQHCPDGELESALVVLRNSDEAGITEIDRLLSYYPIDPRLLFLRGSLLAGVQRYEEGRASMRAAVDVAPDFDIARFQLGFLELTSGLPLAAAETWAPFDKLVENAPFRLFADGLNALAHDAYADADRLIRAGIAANTDHPLINNDMQLLLDEMASKLPTSRPDAEDGPIGASAAHQLLHQFELRDNFGKTRH
jgi:hypothetical protein